VEARARSCDAASSPTFFDRYLDGERFEGEWWPTGDLRRQDEDGSSGSRAATTT
jgi:hypothetical protein